MSRREFDSRGYRWFTSSLLGIALLGAVAATFAGAGNSPNEPPLGEPAVRDSLPPGRWNMARPAEPAPRSHLTDEQRAEFARLQSIGYLTGSAPAPTTDGVVLHDAARTQAGFNLYTSGHFPGAVLMDMEGNVLHEWNCSFDDVWPDYETPEAYESPDASLQRARNMETWRRAYLFENGDILAIYEGLALAKLDKDSRVIWTYRRECHHDLEVADDGTIYVLSRDALIVPWVNARWPILEDYVSVLDPDGNELKRVSILDALERSPYRCLLENARTRGDLLHTNTVELLDGRLADRIPAFKKGNVLISMLRISVVAVLDLESEKIVWAMSGMWHEQHQPTILENGRMMVFDNRGKKCCGGEEESRVMEFDPVTQEVIWTYEGGEDVEFYSHSCGSCQRLPNGNTLISESDYGRAMEVTSQGEIVWEYLNPYRAGDDDEFIATLYEMIRLPQNFPMAWAEWR